MTATTTRPPAGSVTHDELLQLSDSAAQGPIDQAPVLVDAMAQRLLGHRVCSVNRFRRDSMEIERLYSTVPNTYAVGGRKSKRHLPWSEQVLIRGEVFLGTTPKDLEWAFDDHEQLFALGLGSVINTPVMFEGRCLGTFNILHETGWYRPGDEELTRILAHLLLPYLLATTELRER